mmetsp:Transcript_40108/g.78344  ORF Transcript_40108/g.78344 Transcript_40108/m.78344 type:complete len:307 (+) Transcript_40108:236-1156(+)
MTQVRMSLLMKNKLPKVPLIVALFIGLLLVFITNEYHNTSCNNASSNLLTTSSSAMSTIPKTTLINKDISQCQAVRKQEFLVSMTDIHSTNPYDNFSPESYDIKGPDLKGWGLRNAYDKILNEVRPRFMVEVGSWKGLSAVYFANAMREMHGPDACLQLICVDTWLGTTAAWESPDMEKPIKGNTLYLRNGYPSVYYQFLYNVIDQKVDDIIVPLPLPGVMGGIFLQKIGAKPDTVYIDGCHDKICVIQDLESWYPVIGVNGIIFGDDYNRSEVKEAVAHFCTPDRHCQLDQNLTDGITFVLRKIA